MSGWGWLALALSLLDVVIWAVVIIGAGAIVKRYKPRIAPYVAMLKPPTQ